MGAARIQEEMQGDHTFPDLAEKAEGWGRWRGEDKGAARVGWQAPGKSLGGSSRESEGGQVVGGRRAPGQAGELGKSRHSPQSEKDGRCLLGSLSPASFREWGLSLASFLPVLTEATLGRRE